MALSSVRRTSLCKFASPVLGSSTPKFLKDVDHFLKHKGVEWLVDRMKAVYQAALQAKAGHPDKALSILKENRISSRKDFPGIPKGPMGLAALAFVKAERPIVLRRSMALLRAYTGLYCSKATHRQVAKAYASITDPGRETVPDGKFPRSESWRWNLECAPSKKMRTYCERLQLEKLSGTSSFYAGRFKVPSHLRSLPHASAALSSLVCGKVPRSVINIVGESRLRSEAEDFQKHSNWDGYGKITVLQEGGAKARVIACPSFWVQAYFLPLHQILSSMLTAVESENSSRRGISCVLDQNRGAFFLKDCLDKGKEIYSFDLSSATDRFPRSLQTRFLVANGLKDWAKPIDEVSQGPFWFSEKHTFVQYSVGQPMGLYGSFPLFHLTHYRLLEDCAKQAGATRNSFAVLGDDVLIQNRDVAMRYQDAIEKLGISISRAKSYESCDLQTFAGFLGIHTNHGCTVFRPFKHGPDFCINGKEVSLLHSMGGEVRKWSGWWSRNLDIFRGTAPWRNPDLSPLLPKEEQHLCGANVPNSRWFASVCHQMMTYLDGSDPTLQVYYRTMGAWDQERDILFNEQGPARQFSPKDYIVEEKIRKNQIFTDPLMNESRRLLRDLGMQR